VFGLPRDQLSPEYLIRPFPVLPRFEGPRGNAPAEFVLVGALLTALALAVVHVSLVIHVRHVLQASAWEGARYASYYSTTVADGQALARQLITEGLSSTYAESVTATAVTVGGLPGVRVVVSAPIPTVGMWSLGGDIRVEAAVPFEQPG
jgi:Flp pilus assembly protein TadG